MKLIDPKQYRPQNYKNMIRKAATLGIVKLDFA
jgi:hypothetical protein